MTNNAGACIWLCAQESLASKTGSVFFVARYVPTRRRLLNALFLRALYYGRRQGGATCRQSTQARSQGVVQIFHMVWESDTRSIKECYNGLSLPLVVLLLTYTQTAKPSSSNVVMYTYTPGTRHRHHLSQCWYWSYRWFPFRCGSTAVIGCLEAAIDIYTRVAERIRLRQRLKWVGSATNYKPWTYSTYIPQLPSNTRNRFWNLQKKSKKRCRTPVHTHTLQSELKSQTHGCLVHVRSKPGRAHMPHLKQFRWDAWRNTWGNGTKTSHEWKMQVCVRVCISVLGFSVSLACSMGEGPQEKQKPDFECILNHEWAEAENLVHHILVQLWFYMVTGRGKQRCVGDALRCEKRR